jgi:hypothetical protein
VLCNIIAVQELLPDELSEHLQFCDWFLNTLRNDGNVLELTFFKEKGLVYGIRFARE